MKVMVIGGGGREHALIHKLRENPSITECYALPGNGGIAKEAVTIPLAADDIEGMVAFAVDRGIDFAVVAPEGPLALGAVDRLTERGILSFGPTARAAEIECSKVFAKNLMAKYGIPTAACNIFEDYDAARDYVLSAPLPLVVKADGLAFGKGVLICHTRDEALSAVDLTMREKRFGASGEHIVVEEFLEGTEVSVLAFTDSKTLIPMVSSMDHKRAGDGDTGPNTGGMGTVAPNPAYTPELAARAMNEIFLPTMRAMNAEGRPFKGCLYFGLILTQDGPKVIEYNCRFGDPETQVVLPLIETDLLSILTAVAREELESVDVRFSSGSACCVMLASGGYPDDYEKGKVISLGNAPKMPGVTLYHSGTSLDAEGTLTTSGGRVLGVTATGATLEKAIGRAYAAAAEIKFDGAFLRHDIGQRALALETGA